MKTLIELHDDRAFENVLAVDVFRPDTVVYLCADEILSDAAEQEKLRRFFRHRGIQTEAVFHSASIYKSDKILRQLQKLVETHPDCAVDITGGTDAALFACGVLASKNPTLLVFTYSRRKNRFYDINNAEFAEQTACNTEYTVEDFFQMAGGSLRRGRVDNSRLKLYMEQIDPFFDIYLKHRTDWAPMISWMQRAAISEDETDPSMEVDAPWKVPGEHGSVYYANEALLRAFEEIGFISRLQVETGERVRFRFRDEQVRFWLRDTGSVLELYTYKRCLDMGSFNDVCSSAVVDWEADTNHHAVTNEIDVVAARGVKPLFISCKTTSIKTEALNELAILRDRFGGKSAGAAIISTERCGNSARNRAAQLHIAVIDITDIERGHTEAILQAVMDSQQN